VSCLFSDDRVSKRPEPVGPVGVQSRRSVSPRGVPIIHSTKVGESRAFAAVARPIESPVVAASVRLTPACAFDVGPLRLPPEFPSPAVAVGQSRGEARVSGEDARPSVAVSGERGPSAGPSHRAACRRRIAFVGTSCAEHAPSFASRLVGVAQFAACEFRSIVKPSTTFRAWFPEPSRSGLRVSRDTGVAHFSTSFASCFP